MRKVASPKTAWPIGKLKADTASDMPRLWCGCHDRRLNEARVVCGLSNFQFNHTPGVAFAKEFGANILSTIFLI